MSSKEALFDGGIYSGGIYVLTGAFVAFLVVFFTGAFVTCPY
jgi:hypothetical protein